MTYPTIIIISGEGDEGTITAYHGTDSPKAIKTRLVKERCNGDRWARAYRLAQVGDAMSDDIGVYSEIDGDDMRSIDIDDIEEDIFSAASLLGRKGGQAKSERKTAAVRENGKKGGRPGMYTVTLNDADTGTDESWPGLTKRQAISLAKETAAFNPTCAVFIEWFRKSDGQRGYLNPSGDHEITGHAW